MNSYLQLSGFKAGCLIDVLSSLESKDGGLDSASHSALIDRDTEVRDPRLRSKGPAIKRLLVEIERRLPMTERAAESAVGALGDGAGATSVSELLAAAESAGVGVPFRKVRHGGVPILVAREDAAGISACYTAAVRSVQSWGLASVRQIVRHVRVLHRHSIDNRIARAVLSALPRFSWLDQKTGWFWFGGQPNRLARAVGKVFSVARTVKVDELLAAILRSYGFRQRPGRQVIENACAQLPGFRVAGEHVTVERLLDRQRWLSPTELSLVEMLEQRGGAAPLSALLGLAQSWGISLSTFRLAIRRSPVVRMANANLVLI